MFVGPDPENNKIRRTSKEVYPLFTLYQFNTVFYRTHVPSKGIRIHSFLKGKNGRSKTHSTRAGGYFYIPILKSDNEYKIFFAFQ